VRPGWRAISKQGSKGADDGRSCCVDPFAEEGDLQDSNVGTQQNYIHIRIQQRNGRKTLTTLQGLPKGAYSLLCLMGLLCADTDMS
jgi:translation initiation factor SUI1